VSCERDRKFGKRSVAASPHRAVVSAAAEAVQAVAAAPKTAVHLALPSPKVVSRLRGTEAISFPAVLSSANAASYRRSNPF
jgi:hypothetical protein